MISRIAKTSGEQRRRRAWPNAHVLTTSNELCLTQLVESGFIDSSNPAISSVNHLSVVPQMPLHGTLDAKT